MDLMQQQKEAAAMDKLRQLMPQLGDMVRALALSKADWDIDQAVSMLRSFQVSHLDKVNTLNKVSSRASTMACMFAPCFQMLTTQVWRLFRLAQVTQERQDHAQVFCP
jgi:hypothetical protein